MVHLIQLFIYWSPIAALVFVFAHVAFFESGSRGAHHGFGQGHPAIVLAAMLSSSVAFIAAFFWAILGLAAPTVLNFSTGLFGLTYLICAARLGYVCADKDIDLYWNRYKESHIEVFLGNYGFEYLCTMVLAFFGVFIAYEYPRYPMVVMSYLFVGGAFIVIVQSFLKKSHYPKVLP